MRIGILTFLGVFMVLSSAGVLHGEQIASTCRITAVDSAKWTVTLVRNTASGEKTGLAKVAADAKITLAGKAESLGNLVVPLEATVVYDTDQRAVVEIAIAPFPKPTGPEPPRAIAPFDANKAKEYQETWAKHLRVPVEMTNSVGMKLVLIPPGEFDMGSTSEEISQARKEGERRKEERWYFDSLRTETPRHRVAITTAFRMATCEVTVDQFRQFVRDTGYKTDAEKDGKGASCFDLVAQKWIAKPELLWSNPAFAQKDDEPVVAVTWNDATAFCIWLGRKDKLTYRLPTEAEWEYSCRAGSPTRWCFGDDESGLGDYAWFRQNSDWRTHPVAGKRPCAWGLYDMHGNVTEICADHFDPQYYAASPKTDPTGPLHGDACVCRSGSWMDWPYSVRSTTRDGGPPNVGLCNVGFRVAMTLAP